MTITERGSSLLERQDADDETWSDVALGDICDFRSGAGFKENYQGKRQGDHPFIKVSDLNIPGNERLITTATNWVSASELRELRASLQPAGATVFPKVGAALRLNRRRMLARPTAIDNNLMAAIPMPEWLDPEYLYYFLDTQDLGRFSQESAVPSVNQQHLGGIPLSLPSLSEQRRIVAVLKTWDVALDALDRLIAARERRNAAVSRRTFDPCHSTSQHRGDGWRLLNLADAFSERDERDSGDLPLLSVTMETGVIAREDVGRKDTSPEDKSAYKRVLPGDIAYNTMRMWQGVSGLSRHTGIVSPAYTVVVPNESAISGRYAAHLFKAPRMVFDFERHSQGLTSDTWNLKWDAFGRIRVWLPPMDQQLDVVSAFDAMREQLAGLNRQREALLRQKRGLMQKLLTGEWRAPETVMAEVA